MDIQLRFLFVASPRIQKAIDVNSVVIHCTQERLLCNYFGLFPFLTQMTICLQQKTNGRPQFFCCKLFLFTRIQVHTILRQLQML